MTRRKHKRKKVYVSKEIQGRVVTKLAVYWATYHLALWHAMFLFHYFLYRGHLSVDPQMVTVPFPIQYFQFLTRHYSMLLCAAAVFPLIFWDMMKVTHRIAGPLIRFTNTLEQLKKGEKVRKIKLREGDHLIEFQDAFNSYLESAGLLQPGEATGEWTTGNDVAARDSDDESEAEVLVELRGLSKSVAETNTAVDDECEDLQSANADSQ